MGITVERCEKVLRKIAGEFGIVYGMIFGSAGIDRMRKDSDLDVAVKLKKNPKNAREMLKIISKISEAFEKEFHVDTDVVLMNTAKLGLRYEIFKTGKLVFFSNFRDYVEDSSRSVLKYLDMKAFHQKYYDDMLKRGFRGD